MLSINYKCHSHRNIVIMNHLWRVAVKHISINQYTVKVLLQQIIIQNQINAWSYWKKCQHFVNSEGWSTVNVLTCKWIGTFFTGVLLAISGHKDVPDIKSLPNKLYIQSCIQSEHYFRVKHYFYWIYPSEHIIDLLNIQIISTFPALILSFFISNAPAHRQKFQRVS
jgi:hypothetical protein